MTKKKTTTAADPMRRMVLLWGSQTEAGRSGLTVKAIIDTAMAIADTQGVDALSMRNVATRLEVGTMSLYSHVPGKSELLDLMFDTAYSTVYQRVEEPSEQPGDWRDAVRFIAKRNWELLLRHRWMLHITTERPVLGPHAALKYEAELRPLDGLGLDDIEMDATLTLILTHVEGCARMMINMQRTQQDTGVTDAEWWVTQAPLLERIIDGRLFPVSGRVGTTTGEAFQASANPEYALSFGLERILDGVADLIETKKLD